jgi:NodT family efflux transporter outer membrane factor (OMF) lipoprotein
MNMRSLSATLCALLLSACTVGPDFVRPDAPATQGYAAPNDIALDGDQHVALGKKIEDDWWKAFRSPALDTVIKQAIADNRDVAAAKARVAQAQDELNASQGALLPKVALDATAGRQKYGASLFGPLDFTVPPFTYYTVGPAVTFPLDIFGGMKRTVEEQTARREYQAYELNASYLSLTANVTAQALTVASARAQLETVANIIANDQRNVDLVQTAIRDGSGTRTQLLAAQSQLAADQTLLPDLQQQESTARHALAILVGKAPADWTPPDFALGDFTLPDTLPVSLPSDLVRGRPDILAAEAQLHMASAAIGVATANLYPKIDLTGALTQQALTPGGLFNSSANAWTVAANLTQPLFDGGQLSAERQAAIDAYQATLATYEQVILVSFGQVADRLQALANDSLAIKAQRAAADTASSALDLARRSFAAGNSGILDVIDATRHYAQAQLALSQVDSRRFLDTAQLYLAVGGSPVTGSTEMTAQCCTASNKP